MPSQRDRFTRYLCIPVFILMASLFNVARADNDVSAVLSLRCMSTVFAPYVIEKNGVVSGVDVDVVKEIGRRLHIDIEIGIKPWVRLEKDIESGQEQCAFSYFRTSARQAYMDFTNVPLHITSYTLFTQADRVENYRQLTDINGFVVGINRGFKTTSEFEAAVQRGDVKEFRVEQEEQSFQMLNAQRVDAVLTNYFVGAYQIKQLGYTNVVPLFPPLDSTPAFLTFSKRAGLEDLVTLFDSALYEILIDGTYQRIFDRYTKVTSSPSAE